MSPCWTSLTSNWYILLSFLLVRLVATFFSQIPDCDEVFNYWEPLHFLLYGHGLQTWEYSPTFALRTYAYPILHAIPAYIAEHSFGLTNHISIFYTVRACLALVCCTTEIYFICAIERRYGKRVSIFTSIFLLFSPGMFLSSPTFLPSTFTMLALTVSMAAWFDKSYHYALAAATVGTFISCWPYVAVSFIPLGLDALARKNIYAVIGWCFFLVVIVNIPILALDAHYYGFLSYTPWNIVRYNVVEAKANLYGVESWKYYPLNLILNFNVCFILSCLSFIVPIYNMITKKKQSFELLIHLTPLYIWGIVMQTRPHKEERFIYFVYTMICFTGAIALDWFAEKFTYIFCNSCSSTLSTSSINADNDDNDDNDDSNGQTKKNTTKTTSTNNSCYWFVSSLIMLPFILLSVSRIINVIKHYRAPMEIYSHLYNDELTKSWGHLFRFHHSHENAYDPNHHDLPALKYTKDYYNKDIDAGDHVAVCVGKEWYRYPSSFYLRPWSRLYFLKSSFTGQLPSKYKESHDENDIYGTRAHTPYMNDNNKEEITRYIDYKECHYIIDLGKF